MRNQDQSSPSTPAGRLVCSPNSETGGANSVRHHLEDCGLGAAPTVRLAHVDGAQGDGALYGGEGNGPLYDMGGSPALLVSYYYLEPFEKNKHLYRYRDWVMDSGAFSAHNSGAVIDLNRYVDKCLELLSSDPTLTEVFSLDVIPADHKPLTVQRAAEQSLKNCEEMWRQGVPAVPTFHRGEDESFLYEMAKTYPKLAVGGVALLRGDQKRLFCEQVFARVWPKKVHGLGMASEELVFGLPFHSVDATNWELAPCAFGNWQKFGQMSVRGSNQDLRSQVKHYLSLEQKARVRWARQMAELEALPPSPARTGRETAPRAGAPAVRLALDAGAAGGERSKAVLSGRAPSAPTVRLAHKQSRSPESCAVNFGAKEKPTGEMDPKWDDYWKKRGLSAVIKEGKVVK